MFVSINFIYDMRTEFSFENGHRRNPNSENYNWHLYFAIWNFVGNTLNVKQISKLTFNKYETCWKWNKYLNWHSTELWDRFKLNFGILKSFQICAQMSIAFNVKFCDRCRKLIFHVPFSIVSAQIKLKTKLSTAININWDLKKKV